MIFNKKDLKKEQSDVTSERYSLIDRNFYIIYRIKEGCRLYRFEESPNIYKLVFKFSMRQPRSEEEMIQLLNESLAKGGKQKLIRAIYNDFDA